MVEESAVTDLSRRQILASLGVAGSTALAGCGSSTDTEMGEPSDKDVPPPTVETGDQWRETTPDSQPVVLEKGTVAFVDYTAVGHIKQYENSQLRQRISEQTFGEIDRPFMVAFAGRIDLFPGAASLGTALKSDEIRDALISNLKGSMAEFGVENIDDGGTMERPKTDAETWHRVTGEFPIEPVAVEGVDIPHSDKSALEFGGKNIDITGIVGRWKEDGSILAAGGVYPSQPYRETEEIEMSEAISLSVSIDLGLDPEQLERDLFRFIKSISL